jgi:hypothetical protein
MLDFNFSLKSGYNHHECDSVIEGDWVIFRCPICIDYERRINVLTGETRVKNLSSIVSHSGRHNPFKEGTVNTNPELN